MASGQIPEPHVGVFWSISGKVLIDSTPVSEGEVYGNHLTHASSHIDVWEHLQQFGKAPLDSEYEEFPRGRVVFDTKKSEFTMLADTCILKDKSLVAHIIEELRLPTYTKVGGDSHYRCFDCLRRNSIE